MKAREKNFLTVILICLSVYAAYLNTLPNPFIFDDRHTITENKYIKHLETIPKLFTDKVTSLPITKGMWRPLLMLSFASNYFISGLSPHGYHLINILLHFLNAVLLYLLLETFLKELSFGRRLGLTLIFCLHPINTEAVTYISSRSVTMCAFFILSGFYCYVRWRHDRRTRFFLLSLASYIFALMTKEIALILPMLIITYEFIYNKNFWEERKEIILGFLPFLLITLGYIFMIKLIFDEVFGLFAKAKSALATRSYSSNILTQGAVSFFYLYLFFYPFNLCVDHNFPIISSLKNPLGAIPLGLR